MAVADDARRNRWNHIARLNGGEWLAGSAQMGEPCKQHRTDYCRSREQWKKLGVDGLVIADAPPNRDFPVDGLPRLTVRMVARLQSFPDDWQFSGRKTAAYRQVGNAFPPRVARAVGRSIFSALGGHRSESAAARSLRLFETHVSMPVPNRRRVRYR